jgi:hypothetical protein
MLPASPTTKVGNALVSKSAPLKKRLKLTSQSDDGGRKSVKLKHIVDDHAHG